MDTQDQIMVKNEANKNRAHQKQGIYQKGTHVVKIQ